MAAMTVSARESSPLSAEVKREAVARTLADVRFEGAGRLRDFLTYVVEEEIAGRGGDIRAKTIAQDVYGRELVEGSDSENIVRVDARRLRQQLALYYETTGKSDPLHIHLDSGGYRPRFEPATATEVPSPWGAVRKAALPLGTFAVGAALGATLSLLLLTEPPKPALEVARAPEPVDAGQALRRAAIFEKSPASLQAVNLAEQARSLIFPIFDRDQQDLVALVFQRVMEIDPDYYGGYAGAAQVLATRAIITPPGKARDDYLANANRFANEAVRLSPAEAWTQSALAWVTMAGGNYDKALQLSRRAAELDPNDGHVLDFRGSIALFSGEFEEAIAASDRAHLPPNQRFANRNIFGAANFHLGNYLESFESFEAAAQLGNPLSAPSLAYQAAALSAMGRKLDAETKLAELNRAWPGAPLDVMLYGIYKHREHADAVLKRLEDLGWQPVRISEGNNYE